MKKLSAIDWIFVVLILLYISDTNFSSLRIPQWIALGVSAIGIILLIKKALSKQVRRNEPDI